MTRVALDSNVLIYAELEPESEKGTRSAALILRAYGLRRTAQCAPLIAPYGASAVFLACTCG